MLDQKDKVLNQGAGIISDAEYIIRTLSTFASRDEGCRVAKIRSTCTAVDHPELNVTKLPGTWISTIYGVEGSIEILG